METSATLSEHIEVLKLNDEEAETLVGSANPEALRTLGVPEIVLTLGAQGSWVITPDLIEHVPSHRGGRTGRPDRCGGHVLGHLPHAACCRRRARGGGALGS